MPRTVLTIDVIDNLAGVPRLTAGATFFAADESPALRDRLRAALLEIHRQCRVSLGETDMLGLLTPAERRELLARLEKRR